MSAATANAVSPPWDHYVCYVAKDIVKPSQLPPAVGLQDQFTQGNYKVGKAKYLCPPAGKNAEPVFDQVTHLKIYPIKRLKPGKDQLPPHGVMVDNQFGQQQLKVGATTGLMVPTTKGLAGPPPPPNPAAYSYEHYKCYKASRQGAEVAGAARRPVRKRAGHRGQGHAAVQSGRQESQRGDRSDPDS